MYETVFVFLFLFCSVLCCLVLTCVVFVLFVKSCTCFCSCTLLLSCTCTLLLLVVDYAWMYPNLWNALCTSFTHRCVMCLCDVLGSITWWNIGMTCLQTCMQGLVWTSNCIQNEKKMKTHRWRCTKTIQIAGARCEGMRWHVCVYVCVCNVDIMYICIVCVYVLEYVLCLDCRCMCKIHV